MNDRIKRSVTKRRVKIHLKVVVSIIISLMGILLTAARFPTWPLKTVALAVAYALAGWLGSLLAVPPGYVTAIFPASGIAFAVLAANGIRLWPGVWAGSFALCMAMAFDSFADMTVDGIALAATVAAGASLQAVTGAVLVRRFVPDHSRLQDARDILLFLAIGGPLACLLSPAVGTAAYWFFETNPADDLVYGFWVRWVGESMGVTIVAPLALVFLRFREKIWWRRFFVVLIPSMVALLAVVAIFIVANRLETERVTSKFYETTDKIVESVNHRLNTYLQAVVSVGAFAGSVPAMERRNFSDFARNLIDRYPGIQTLEWIPIVSESERGRLEAETRRNGFPDFRITERNAAGDLVSAARRAEYFPMYFIEPLEGNELAMGFDLGSDPARLKAIKAARDSGLSAATSGISLVRGGEHKESFLIVSPVYAEQYRKSAQTKRHESPTGFVLGVLRLGPLTGSAISSMASSHMSIEIDDITPNENYENLYRSHPAIVTASSRLSFSQSLAVADRLWEVRFHASSAYEREQRSLQSWFILLGGLLFVALLQAYLLFISGQTDKTRRQIEDRTLELVNEIEQKKKIEEELRASEMRVSGILNTAVDGIITIDSKGTIETTNPAVEQIFGWNADEMIGRNVKMLMPEPDYSGHDGYLHNYVKTGRAKIIGSGREVSGRRKDGTIFPIELSVGELQKYNGRAFVGILRDISDRKAAEDKIVAVSNKMKLMVAALQRRDRGLTMISRMNDLLMACNTREEAYRVIELCATDIFAKRSGALAVLSDNERDLNTVLRWGNRLNSSKFISVNDCWALRKGTLHEVDDPARGMVCDHVSDPPENGYLCQPLLVHGTLFGLLSIQTWEAEKSDLENYRNLIMTMGETIKITLSNLTLREVLHEQAIRDPLTRLLNRRAMEEGLEREIAHARRNKKTLVVGMMDIDFFKRVNDTYGHDVGDYMLRELGNILSKTLRSSDIICRYGGEEILIAMPDSDVNAAARRIEEIRQRFSNLAIKHDDMTVGPVTLSAGLTVMREAGATVSQLISIADKALLAAKKAGRDCLIIANDEDMSNMQSVREQQASLARAIR